MKRLELMDDERIILEEPIHWKNYLLPMTALGSGTFITAVRIYLDDKSVINKITGAMTISPEMNSAIVKMEVAIILAIMLVALIKMIQISYIKYYLTNKRIISTSGVLNIRQEEMLLSRCETVYITQSAYERIYNCGDLLCVAPGSQIYLDDVKDARGFKQAILAEISKSKGNG